MSLDKRSLLAMEVDATMDVTFDAIFERARAICQAALGLDIESAGHRAGGAAESIAACIKIAGGWNGRLLLDCPEELARSAAAILFGLDRADVRTTDMQDAVCELVNLIATQIEGLLPARCYLSQPVLGQGRDQWAAIRGNWPLGQVAFRCQGHEASIVIAEQIGEMAMAA